MSDWMVKEFRKLFQEIRWPDDTQTTPEQQAIYEQGMDILGSYRGHPDTLLEALKYFVGSKSRPYAFAGAARVMSCASYQSDDKYDADGMEEAVNWLEKAQEIVSDRQEINVIEANLYMQMHRDEDARKVLDYLSEQGELTLGICSLYLYYWDHKHNIPEAESWFEAGFKLTKNNVQRLNLLNSMAGTYMMNKVYDKAIDLFEQVLQIDPKDPWAWHNVSWMLLQRKEYERAYGYNQKALSIMEFGAAQEIEKILKKRLAGEGKSPPASNQSKPAQQQKGWFKKLTGQ